MSTEQIEIIKTSEQIPLPLFHIVPRNKKGFKVSKKLFDNYVEYRTKAIEYAREINKLKH